MNDDELNELLARDDQEVSRFRELDAERERTTLENWRAAGNRGKPPPGLMCLEELPECYRNDDHFEIPDVEDAIEGRGQRVRKSVVYTDGLSDEQWAMVCEAFNVLRFSSSYCEMFQALEEGDSILELQENSRRKKERRAANKLLKEVESGRGTPISETDSARGKKGKKGKSKMNPSDFDPPVTGKRKRGNQSMTPSVVDEDEDEDERDQKRRKTKVVVDIAPAIREKMKKAFNECYKAVQAIEATNDDGTTRKRCELFREVPDKKVRLPCTLVTDRACSYVDPGIP